MNTRNKLIGGVLVGAVALTAGYEGLKTTAYHDTGGIWTICHGSTLGVKQGDVVSIEDCRAKLTVELAKHNKPLERLPRQLPANVHIAWLDFCYNVGVGACGSSTGYTLLERGDYGGACRQLLRWKYTQVNGELRDCSVAGSGCAGIWARRQGEYRLCVGG
jgi:lysozyme